MNFLLFSFALTITLWYSIQLAMFHLSPDKTPIISMDRLSLICLTIIVFALLRFFDRIWFSYNDTNNESKKNTIKSRFLLFYPHMSDTFAAYLQTVYDRCIHEYYMIVSANPNIDAGHSVNHVIKVEELTFQALNQYYSMIENSDPTLRLWATRFYAGDQNCLKMPKNAVLRIMIASLLHEVGDIKFEDKSIKKPKADIIGEVVTRVLHDYNNYNDKLKTDIINMIDYCSASTWGNKIPENSKLYQLICRFADRLEATGYIGIVRTMTFAYTKRSTYPLCRDEDEFPTTLEELDIMAPDSRWQLYSSGKKPSESGFAHYLDKIVHISGNDVPIPFLRDALNEGQNIVKQFVIDFTTKNNKQFDIDWVIDHLDPEIYNVEVNQIKEMQRVMRNEGSKWIK